MPKLHICHLSLLNPLLHPRIYFKHAISARLAGHEVSVIGQGRGEAYEDEHGIHMLPLQVFSRLSAERLSRRQELYQMALELEADIYVLHSPELLGLAKKLKFQTGAKILYDVHEDYRLNIRHAIYYPWGVRHLLAAYARFAERRALAWLDGVIYAEQCYDNILNVPAGKKLILPNTYTPRGTQGKSKLKVPKEPYLLLSGTIAEERGLWESLQCWEAINALQPMRLLIAGHCQLPALLSQLRGYIAEHQIESQVQIIGGEQYVSAADIQALIKHCYAGIFLYRSQANLIGKYPTKLFEYMAFDKPLIYTDHPHWLAFDQRVKLGVPWKGKAHANFLLKELDNWTQNPPQHKPEQYLWEAKEEKLLWRFLDKL
ncbi:MAG: glycosyltransferase [Bacteroidota bacterium]